MTSRVSDPPEVYATMQIFTYNIYDTDATGERAWFPEPKRMRGRSTNAIADRIAAEARATTTQAHVLAYRIWLEGELVTIGTFGVRRRFRDGDRVEATDAARGSGKIDQIDGKRARVAWDDGTSGWHALSELRPFGRKQLRGISARPATQGRRGPPVRKRPVYRVVTRGPMRATSARRDRRA